MVEHLDFNEKAKIQFLPFIKRKVRLGSLLKKPNPEHFGEFRASEDANPMEFDAIDSIVS